MNARSAATALAAFVVLVVTALGGYQIGARTRGNNGDQAGVCAEAVSRKEQLLSQPVPTTIADRYGLTYSGTRDEFIRSVLREVAILVEQNPTCFSPTERANVVARAREGDAR